jgi:hypothetical protein
LVVLGASQELLVVHDPEICSLDRVIGVEGVRHPMLAVVVCVPSYFDFISYVATPTSLCMIGLDRGGCTPASRLGFGAGPPWMLAVLAALLAALPAALAGALAGALAAVTTRPGKYHTIA